MRRPFPQPDGYPQEYQADPSKACYAQPNGSLVHVLPAVPRVEGFL